MWVTVVFETGGFSVETTPKNAPFSRGWGQRCIDVGLRFLKPAKRCTTSRGSIAFGEMRISTPIRAYSYSTRGNRILLFPLAPLCKKDD